MNKNSLFLLLLILFSYSCLKENKIVIKHDFENNEDGWSKTGIKEGQGHSGKFFIHTDSLTPYSAGFGKKLSDITPKKVKRIDIISWINKTDVNSVAEFIVSLDKNGRNVFWKSMSTKEAFPELNEWTRVYASYDVPDSLGKDEFLQVYLWNNNKLPLDADDFEIRLFY